MALTKMLAMIDLTTDEQRQLRGLADELLAVQGGDQTAAPTPTWDNFVAAVRPTVVLLMLNQIERLAREESGLSNRCLRY